MVYKEIVRFLLYNYKYEEIWNERNKVISGTMKISLSRAG